MVTPHKIAVMRFHNAHRQVGRCMAFDGSRLQYYLERELHVRQLAVLCESDALRQQLERVADEYAAIARQIEKGLLPD